MLKVFVAGNPLLKIDSLPLRILPRLSIRLPMVFFEEFDPTENFPEAEKMVILDTVVGLKKVEIIEGTDSFSLPKACSLHDFDLGTNLRLMQKAGIIKEFRIIGVPPDLGEREAIEQIVGKIRASLL